MAESVERHEFQAEVKELLGLVVHSLYSNKDIALRELVSNASDALDKLRFERVTRPELASGGELQIRLEVDREKRTLSVLDNGIGMSREEVKNNIGTIARSGTKEFLSALKASERKDVPPELIGQFGVGFYSAFMIADKVEVVTRRAGESTATRWESLGDGSYTLGDGERATEGTTVTLHLKAPDPEQGLHDYTEVPVLREIIKRYSDFVGYPIRTKSWRKPEGAASDAPVLEDETLNSMKAIWDRPKNEVSEDEYKEFYRHVSHDWSDPLRTIPVRLEGTIEAYALLYLPAKAPLDLFSPEMKRGLQLYVKRVFVMDECRDIMPPYLRFVRGVVDAHDLSLNVSREILQKDRQIQIIAKQLVRRVLATLEEMKKESFGEYQRFFAEFGAVLKEGLLPYAGDQRDKLLELLIAPSTVNTDQPTTLEDYVGRMKEGQDAIYVLTAPTPEAAAESPLLEKFKAKGYEVLLFSDPVDEIWLESAPAFKDKKLVSIARGDIELGTEEERKKEAEALDEKRKEYADLMSCLRVHLQDEIKEVRLSQRLTRSPVCLVAGAEDLSPRVQRMLRQMGQEPPKTKRVLELNPEHPIVEKLQAAFKEDGSDPRLKLYAELLLGQAHLAESGELPDPAAFSRALADAMQRGL